MKILEQMAYHLEFLGFGRVPNQEQDGDIFWGTMPDSPDSAIGVFATDASYPGSKTGGRFQIICRAQTDRDAFETCCEIVSALDDYNGFLAGGYSKAIIWIINGAKGMGMDDKKRKIYGCNVRVQYCEYE